MELSTVSASNLDKFIEDHLLPDTQFHTEVTRAINIIRGFLKERCFQDSSHSIRVSKVIKGGSSGKGTTLRGRSEADLVIFLVNLTSFEDQLRHQRAFIREIRRQLEAFQRERSDVRLGIQSPPSSNSRVLSFVLSSSTLKEEVEFNVLLAFDVLGKVRTDNSPNTQIYIRLIQECTSLNMEGKFSTCFTELRRAFFMSRPPKLKSLIFLVKHWYQLCKEKLGKSLPPQYALELLTVYAWERGSSKLAFSVAQGFQTVLRLVIKYQELCIYWTTYYNFDEPIIGDYLTKQLQKPRPVILDPADPTGNVGGGSPEGWQHLAQEAEAWLNFPCFKKWDGSPVDFWHERPQTDSGRPGSSQQMRNLRTHEVLSFPHKGYTSHPVPRPQEDDIWMCTIL